VILDREAEELEFNSAVNGVQLVQSLHVLQQLGEKLSATEGAFWVRFGLENPEIVDQDAYDRKSLEAGNTSLLEMGGVARRNLSRQLRGRVCRD
jgi:hypothetical protein